MMQYQISLRNGAHMPRRNISKGCDDADVEISTSGKPDILPTLLNSKDFYEAIVAHIRKGLCVYDHNWRLLLCNEPYAEIFQDKISATSASMELKDVVAGQMAGGLLSTAAGEEYIAWCHNLSPDSSQKTYNIILLDGRVFDIEHCLLSTGVWIAFYNDLTSNISNTDLVHQKLSIQTLIDNVPDYLWVKDRDSRFLIANKALAADWGRVPSQMIGLTDATFHPAQAADAFRASEHAIMSSGMAMIDRPEFVFDSQGNGKWFSSSKVPLRNADGAVFGIVGIARDITDLRREVALREGQTNILEMIATSAPLDNILNSIVLLIESLIPHTNASLLLLSSDSKRLYSGSSPNLHSSYAAAVDDLSAGLSSRLPKGDEFFGETVSISEALKEHFCQNGARNTDAFNYISCSSTPITSHDGRTLGHIALYSHMARTPSEYETATVALATRIAGIAIDRQKAEERINYMASHDALTGLLNRSMLNDHVAKAIERAIRHDRKFHLLFMDVDNFKIINDSFGHNIGDELLKEVAARIIRSVHQEDVVIRLGGDEFVIILTDRPTSAGYEAVSFESILAAVNKPMMLAGHQLSVSGSLGVASFPSDGHNSETLLKNADAAMYQAKQNGRNNFQIYGSQINGASHYNNLSQ